MKRFVMMIALGLIVACGGPEEADDAVDGVAIDAPEEVADAEREPMRAEIPSDYAPWAPGAADPRNVPAVPGEAVIGVPPYPGAVLVSASTSKMGEMLPWVNLLSEDSPEEVIEWYRTRLEPEGWSWDETFEILYRGESASSAMGGEAPFINIMEPGLESADMINVDDSVKESARSRIQITFDPDA